MRLSIILRYVNVTQTSIGLPSRCAAELKIPGAVPANVDSTDSRCHKFTFSHETSQDELEFSHLSVCIGLVFVSNFRRIQNL